MDPEFVVDLTRIAELRGIREDGDRLVVGAPGHAPRAGDQPAHPPACATSWPRRAPTWDPPQIRHQGTLGRQRVHGQSRRRQPARTRRAGGAVPPAQLPGQPGGSLRAVLHRPPADRAGAGGRSSRPSPSRRWRRASGPAGASWGPARRRPSPRSPWPCAAPCGTASSAAVRIALGSVAPTVVRAPRAEAFLEGRALDASLAREAEEGHPHRHPPHRRHPLHGALSPARGRRDPGALPGGDGGLSSPHLRCGGAGGRRAGIQGHGFLG